MHTTMRIPFLTIVAVTACLFNTFAQEAGANFVGPDFRGGGAEEFRMWVADNVVYPKDAQENRISGKVVVSFVVEIDGSVNTVEIVSSTDNILSEEILRVIKNSPKWIPGKENGRPVRVKYTLPLEFRLPETEFSSTDTDFLDEYE